MKKTLALVLALMMVLALVPAAFAATTTNVSSDSYDVKVTFDPETVGSVEDAFKGEYKASGKAPAVSIAVPYDAIPTTGASASDPWATSTPKMKVEVKTFGGNLGAFNDLTGDSADFKIYINGADKTDDVTFAGNVLTFDTDGFTKTNATYSYNVKLVYTNKAADATFIEEMNFTISYTNTTKPVYELKFGQPDTDGVVLKDGVYFIDSATNTAATLPSGDAEDKDTERFLVNVFKNDGSKFTETAYYAVATGDYPSLSWATNNAYKVNGDSQLKIYTTLSAKEANKSKTVYVTVETQYAFYQGKVTFKYRTNVSRVDPKGVFFAKDEYTIGVNEVLEPTYTTTVPVWHDVADCITLTQSANTEKGIVDCDGNKITGLREGTAYVILNYRDTFVRADGAEGNWVYTDTVKVTVKGTYQVTDKANYIVTTSSSNLNVRSGAGTKYSKIGSLAKGTVVEVVEIKDGWAKIIFPSANYTNGYVSAQYLTKQSTSPETVIGTKTVIARVLNVRSGAGTSYSIVGKLNRNTKVEVIETVANGSWSKIKFNGGYAYVSSTYIQ